MTETKKKTSSNVTKTSSKQGVEQVAKTAEEVFNKLKKHFESKKVDAWQKKWLAIPANRKKYEKLYDAPDVVSKKLSAMTNDIIDFVHKEEGSKSHLFKKIKSGLSDFFKNPAAFMQKKGPADKKAEKTTKAHKK